MINVGPMLFKEFAVRMRGSRSALLIGLYVALALIAARLLYGAIITQIDQGAPLLSAQIGQVIFIGLSLGLQALTVFLAPAAALNAISSEYERGTADLLITTPLSPLQFVAGKLVSALAFTLLLLIAVLPVFAVVVLFGGVSSDDLVRVGVTLLVTALTGCLFGLCCSALTRQTYTATLICYALLVTLIGGTLFAANVWSLANGMRAAPPALIVANPISAMASALVPTQPPAVSFTGGLRPLVLLSLMSRGMIETGALGGPVPLYRASIVLYLGLALVLFWASLRLAPPRRTWRINTLDVALFIVFLGYLVLLYGAREWWLPGLGIVSEQP
ncbi:MAG: ABC transporter permease [Oscillochloridaceae bacterium umkhey_bin13]